MRVSFFLKMWYNTCTLGVYRMAYEGRCGSCENFEDNNGRSYDKRNPNYIKGFCTWYRSYYYPDDFCDNHYRSRGGSSGGCYITTIICDKLGFSDDCETLEVLRDFRGNVLQKDEKYAPLLYEYDVVGPKIAEEMEKEDTDFVEALYQGFIVPIVEDIKSKNYSEAIHNYVTMTKCLEESYGIDFSMEIPKTYDYQKGGHGSKKVKKYRLAI